MIDWDRADELLREIGEEDFAEVADVFIDELNDVLGSLTADQDHAEIQQSMHFIKGCALNIGFERLAELASQAERCAANEQETGYVDLNALRDVFQRSKTAFASRFGDPAAA
ncbi:MAG: Hpt domain-containing protein [Pseudomonadota bacterium]